MTADQPPTTPLTDSELRDQPVSVTVTGPLPSGPAQSQLLTSTDVATPTEVIRQQVSSQDYVVLRFAVLGLMLAIVIALIGVIFLAWQERELPDGIVAIGSASVGALATMLVRPPLFPQEPQRMVGQQLPPPAGDRRQGR